LTCRRTAQIDDDATRMTKTPTNPATPRIGALRKLATAVIALASLPGLTPADAGPLSSIVDAPAPEWVLDIAPGTWAEISRNVLADVDPARDPKINPNYPSAPPWRGATGQKGVINAWNGGAFASRVGRLGSLVVFGGGHNDYFGNEIYAFDLEQRTWRRLTDPFVASREVLTALYEGAEFPDGSPLPPHTYDYAEYHPGSNSFVILKGLQQLGVSGGVVSGAPAHLFRFHDQRWYRTPVSAAPYGSAGWSAYDSLRDVFWVNPPGYTPRAGFRSLSLDGRNSDGSIGSWSGAIGPRKQGGGDGVAAYDPVHDIIVYTDFRQSRPAAFAVDLGRPAEPSERLKLGGAAPSLTTAHGWEWSDLRNAFIYWPRTAGAAVHELRLHGSDWRAGVWKWSSLTRPDNTVVPQSMTADNGVYGRFRLARFSNAEIALVVNRVDGPVYAFRVPETALAN
jgi:hypothetical protein